MLHYNVYAGNDTVKALVVQTTSRRQALMEAAAWGEEMAVNVVLIDDKMNPPTMTICKIFEGGEKR